MTPLPTRTLNRALVRMPARSLIDACELTHIERQPIDGAHILQEHQHYQDTLRALGLTVTCLPAIEAHPDSVFMEDAAVVLDELLVLTRPTTSREAEPEHLLVDAGDLRRPVARIVAPGRLEGGDVLRIGRHLMVGLTTRSNAEGVNQLRRLVEPFGYTVSAWEVGRSLHFKTACTALDDGCLLLNPDWVDATALAARGFEIVTVDPSEPFGANVLRIDGRLVVNASFPATRQRIEQAWARRGHDLSTLHATPLAEFGKAEAGLTCMSLVYAG